MSQLFTSGGQSIGVSASTSVLPMNTQDWFPLGWTGWISLQSKGLSRVFSNTTVQKHQIRNIICLQITPKVSISNTLGYTPSNSSGNSHLGCTSTKGSETVSRNRSKNSRPGKTPSNTSESFQPGSFTRKQIWIFIPLDMYCSPHPTHTGIREFTPWDTPQQTD